MTDRAGLLARMADDFMATGQFPPIGHLPDGCTGFRVELWPEAPADPVEVHFIASWPDIALVCRRSLAGYSLDGGLHREPG